MYRALAYKELREILGIAIIAFVGYLALATNLMGMHLFAWVPIPRGTHGVPFASQDFLTWFTFVCIPFVIALGFRQSIRTDGRSRYQFLLHRPMPRGAIMTTKLLTGISVYLVCSAVPILLYGWWAATPGKHPGPFEWSMIDTTLHVWLSMTLLYLGTFLSGIRPARWLGTRLLPLIGCAMLVFLVANVPWWWACGLALLAVLSTVLIANICFVARNRDYS